MEQTPSPTGASGQPSQVGRSAEGDPPDGLVKTIGHEKPAAIETEDLSGSDSEAWLGTPEDGQEVIAPIATLDQVSMSDLDCPQERSPFEIDPVTPADTPSAAPVKPATLTSDSAVLSDLGGVNEPAGDDLAQVDQAPGPNAADSDTPTGLGLEDLDLDFSDLITSGALAEQDNAAGASFREIHSVVSPDLDTAAFRGFAAVDPPPKAGNYAFAVRKSDLQTIATITGTTAEGSEINPGLVTFTITSELLRARTYDKSGFTMRTAFLAEPASDIAPESAISFSVALDDLAMTLMAVDDKVHLTLQADRKRVIVQSGRFERPIILRELKPGDNLSEEIVGPVDSTAAVPLPTGVLRKALEYLSHTAIAYANRVAEKGRPEDGVRAIEVRDGYFMGGRPDVVARVHAPALEGISFRVRTHFVEALLTVLPYLQSDAVLLDTGNFYIVRDHNTLLGMEKTTQDVPKPENLKLLKEGRVSLCLPRNDLLAVTAAVDAVARMTPVRLRVSGGDNARCTFVAEHSDRRRIKAKWEASRRDASNPAVDTELSVTPLRLAAEVRDDTTNISLDIDGARRFVMIDHWDGKIQDGLNRVTIVALPPARRSRRNNTPAKT